MQFNENSEVFTSFEEEEEFDLKKRRKSSAEKVKGQIFDVAFKDPQELSAAKLRDRMKVIIQASIEEDEEKVRYLLNAPKLAWTQLSGNNNETENPMDWDQIQTDKNPVKKKKDPFLRKSNTVSVMADTESQAVSEDQPCPLSMNHRHTAEGLYESPECTADLSEFALSSALNLVHHSVINSALLTLILVYSNLSENQWEMSVALQVISACFHPFLEFLFSAKVRFFLKDLWDGIRGENIPSNTVFVA